MSSPVRPVAVTPDEDEFQAWKRGHGNIDLRQRAESTSVSPRTPDEAEFQQWKAQAVARALAASGARPTTLQKWGAIVGQGVTGGFAGKILGALDAVNHVAPRWLGGDDAPASTFGSQYTKTRDRITNAESQGLEEHPITGRLAEVGAGVAASLPAALAGSGASVARAALPLRARIARGALVGSGYGAVTGAGHATGDVGDYAREIGADATAGAILGGAAPAAGAALRGVGSFTLDNLVGRPIVSRPVVRIGPIGVGHIEGQADRASRAIAQRAEMDRAAGFVAPRGHPSLPALPLDQAGPNVEGLAEGIANRPGPGRAIIQTAIQKRQAQMRPAITQEFDNATGTTAADGEDLLRQLADEYADQGSAARAAKAVGSVNAAAKPDVQVPVPADVWADHIGGTHPNGIALLRQMSDAQRAEADHLYGIARDATAGRVVQSPTLDQFSDTPVGKLAFSWAKMQKANRLSPSSTVTETQLPPEMQALLDQAKPEHKAALLDAFKATGATRDVTTDAMDPELLHYAKQYTAKLARMGVNDGAQGTLATQAQGALPLFNAIKSEMPEEWQAADAAFSKHARMMDALNAGRNIFRTKVNPAGGGKKPLFNSLDALEQKAATLPPEERHALQMGAQSAISDQLKSGTISKSFIAQLQDPASPASRRVALATGDPDAARVLAAKLQPTEVSQQLLAPPPVPELSASGQGAAQGLDVLRHGISAPGNAPGKSLGLFADRARSLPPEGKIALQQGAAQAFRGEWMGTGRSVRSPGRVFDFSSPEKATQMGYAFQSPSKAQDFQQAVAAWDRAQAQADRLTGNSRTGIRGSEGSGSGSLNPNTLVSGPRAIVRSILDRFGGATRAANRQNLEAEVARILASPDLQLLPLRDRSVLLQNRVLEAVHANSLQSAIDGTQQRRH